LKTLEKDWLLLLLKQLLRCRSVYLCLTPASSISTKLQQETVWPSPIMLVLAINTFLAMPAPVAPADRAQFRFLVGQADSLLLACLGQGFGGALVVQLLLAANHLRLQAGEHPSKPWLTYGISLKKLLGTSDSSSPSKLERLLAVPRMVEGAAHAAVEALYDHQHFWWVHKPRPVAEEVSGTAAASPPRPCGHYNGCSVVC
jgi:hypothetical protein